MPSVVPFQHRLSRRTLVASSLATAGWTSALSAGSSSPSALAQEMVGQEWSQSRSCPRLIVPAYFDPGAEWQSVIDAAAAVEFVVLNINSGPGLAPDPSYQRMVRRAQAAGIKVLGYVYTNLALRAIGEVKQEIQAYQRWYGVDGIHIDGAQDDPEFVAYYKKVAAAIRAAGRDGRDGIVFLNPGYVPAEEYMEFVDIVETYEWFYEKYQAQEFPDWVFRYPADRFAHIIYSAPSDENAMREMLALAHARNAGYVYITDLDQPTEYLTLPSFWDAKVAALCP